MFHCDICQVELDVIYQSGPISTKAHQVEYSISKNFGARGELCEILISFIFRYDDLI